MTTEWGALAGLFEIDHIVIDWFKQRADFIVRRGLAGVPSDIDGDGMHPRLNKKRIGELENSILQADPGCFYTKEITIDLGSIEPYVSGPDHVKVMTAVSEIRKKKIAINKAYLVSCVNSRMDDLKQAASVDEYGLWHALVQSGHVRLEYHERQACGEAHVDQAIYPGEEKFLQEVRRSLPSLVQGEGDQRGQNSNRHGSCANPREDRGHAIDLGRPTSLSQTVVLEE